MRDYWPYKLGNNFAKQIILHILLEKSEIFFNFAYLSKLKNMSHYFSKEIGNKVCNIITFVNFYCLAGEAI